MAEDHLGRVKFHRLLQQVGHLQNVDAACRESGVDVQAHAVMLGRPGHRFNCHAFTADDTALIQRANRALAKARLYAGGGIPLIHIALDLLLHESHAPGHILGGDGWVYIVAAAADDIHSGLPGQLLDGRAVGVKIRQRRAVAQRIAPSLPEQSQLVAVVFSIGEGRRRVALFHIHGAHQPIHGHLGQLDALRRSSSHLVYHVHAVFIAHGARCHLGHGLGQHILQH